MTSGGRALEGASGQGPRGPQSPTETPLGSEAASAPLGSSPHLCSEGSDSREPVPLEKLVLASVPPSFLTCPSTSTLLGGGDRPLG